MTVDDIVKFYEYIYRENPYALQEIYKRACNFYEANITQCTMEQFNDRKTKPKRNQLDF